MPSMSALRRQVCANLRHSSAPRLRALSGHARLSALTLAALATGYHPDGSALEPGFPKTDLTGVLPAWPSFLRLCTPRADRSFCRSTGDPEPPGSGLAIPRAGTAPRFRLSGLPFRKGALNERGDEYVTKMATIVKGCHYICNTIARRFFSPDNNDCDRAFHRAWFLARRCRFGLVPYTLEKPLSRLREREAAQRPAEGKRCAKARSTMSLVRFGATRRMPSASCGACCVTAG